MIPSLRLAAIAIALLCVVSALQATAQNVPDMLYRDMRWRMIGPFRGGRTRAVAGIPNSPNVFFMGQVNGGVWRSDDYGRTWVPIFDSEATQSIGAIAIAASDPNILYVATGEGLHRPDLSVGNGIYKSVDGGKTWKHQGLSDGQQIAALAIDPRDPNRVMAAVLGHPYGPNTERGVFRSTDGGNSWQRVLYKGENTGGSDVEIDPKHPDIIYASLWEAREGPWEDNNGLQGTGGGLFKSTDGGSTWKQLSSGLPANLTQVNVAVAGSAPDRLYASVATTEKGEYGSGAGLGIYRSDNAGQSWYPATSDPRPAMRIGGGDLPVLRVDPKNPDVLYSVSIVTLRSTDGGKSWSSIRGAPGGDDYQNLWINPADPNIILLGSDQGAIVTVNGGTTWSSWYNQPTAQLYHVSASNEFPYRVCGGQQESGSVCISSRGNDGEITFRDWHPVGTIEYGYVAPDPLDSSVVYGAGRAEVSKFHWSTGQVQNITPVPLRSGNVRADRTEPIIFSPVDPHVLYYATNVLFKTLDGGNSWQAISPDLSRPAPGAPPSVGTMLRANPAAAKQRGVIYALAPSFQTVNTIWAGTDDGQIWITRDGGKNWGNITPPELTPWSKITQIAASHFDDKSAYVSVSRFRIDDLHPYVYRTHDGGRSWRLITSGLPQGPADTVREDSVRKGLLFAGTENAVWVSFDDGDHWQSLQFNLPHTSMRDLCIHDNDLIVATHGRSFWILDDITPLRQATVALAQHDLYLFPPARAYRVRRSTNTDTPLPPDEPAGQNPPDGAVIDYYLSRPVPGPLTLEILDARGTLVRRYSTTDKPVRSEEELRRQIIPTYWIRKPQTLSASPGMHRWVWDMHLTPPASTRHEYPIAAVPGDTPLVPQGPLALPGRYTVRLTGGGQEVSATLSIEMDPRVKTTVAGLEQQFQLEDRLASLLMSSATAVQQALSMQQQLRTLSRRSGAPGQTMKALDQKLAALLTKSPAEKLRRESLPPLSDVNTDIQTLYGFVGQADAAPTGAQRMAVASLERELADNIKRWTEITNSDLPELNKQLQAAGLPEVHLGTLPEAEGDPE